MLELLIELIGVALVVAAVAALAGPWWAVGLAGAVCVAAVERGALGDGDG